MMLSLKGSNQNFFPSYSKVAAVVAAHNINLKNRSIAHQ